MDQAALRAVFGGDTRSLLTYLMIGLTGLGSGWTVLVLVPVFFFRRARRFATVLLGVIVAQSATVDLLKLAVGRVRPWMTLGLHAIIELPKGASFPSGHAAGSFSVAAYCAIILFARRRRTNAALASAALFALAASISFSRVYLGAHWPTDVLAGAALGAAFGAIGAWIFLRAAAPGREPEAATL